ncbi:MAG: hypothetical protein ACYCX7_05970 [Solirubrobacteraceae bacterium]
MLRSRIYLCALLLAGALASGAIADAGTAAASKSQTTYFQAPHELLDPATRGKALSQMEELGVNAVRLEIEWEFVAPEPNATRKPAFDAKEPSSYGWGQYEAAINEIHQRGWKLLLTVSAPAPRWATQSKKAPYVLRPNNRDFEEFMTAVGKKFRSDVTEFGIWNEPNEFTELQPQFNRKGLPESGRVYRGLFLAGYRGLQKAGLGKPSVLMGETSPGGFTKLSKGVPNFYGVAPITFLRNTLCLNAQYRREKGCSGSLPASGYSQHPYALNGEGPYDRPKSGEDVTIATIGRLVAALNKAAKAGAVKPGLPIFLTEYGVMSKPNKSIDAVSVEKQAAYDAIAEHVAWNNGRVVAFSQYLLQDDPTYRGKGITSFQTGLEYSSGAKKPLYYSFPVPLTVTPFKGGYNLWGYVRPARKATTVTVLVQRKKSKAFTMLKKVRTGPSGYWTLKSNVQGSYWKVRWVSPEGKKYEGTRIGAYPLP